MYGRFFAAFIPIVYMVFILKEVNPVISFAFVGVLCSGFCSLASPTTALSHPMCKKAKLILSNFIKFYR